MQWHPPLIRHHTNLWLHYRTWSYYRFLLYYRISKFGFHRTYAKSAVSQQRTFTPLGTLFCTIWDLDVSNGETSLSWTCRVSGLWVLSIPRYFYFAYVYLCQTQVYVYQVYMFIENLSYSLNMFYFRNERWDWAYVYNVTNRMSSHW